MDEHINIRAATLTDVSLIFSFLKKKADFDRTIGSFSGELRVSEAKIRKTIFGAMPFSHVVFATLASREIGFALYGFRYSSFMGQPSIWLDDLYVDEELRGNGAGAALMSHLAQIAKANECSHLAWNADTRNPRGLKFYDRLGAKITEQNGTRCILTWTPSSVLL
jgi:GNAT superfamily N-acetyltransferase